MCFYSEELLAPYPTPKLEDHPLSAVRDCLFNIFAVTLHIGGHSSIRNLRTRHAVVTGTHLSWFSQSIQVTYYMVCFTGLPSSITHDHHCNIIQHSRNCLCHKVIYKQGIHINPLAHRVNCS